MSKSNPKWTFYAAALVLLSAAAVPCNRARAAAATAPASRPASERPIQWEVRSPSAKLFPAAEVRKSDLPPASTRPSDVLRVDGAWGGEQVCVLKLDKPGITADSYAVAGMVRYANVQGQGYLEMWSYFPDGGHYFSRTLDLSGPMGALHGNSEWRQFELPFTSKPGYLPSRIEVNVVLPQGGTVWLGPAELVQPASGADAAASASTSPAAGWWDERVGAMLGAALGSTLGLCGAIVGLLGGMGRARRAMMAMAATLFINGVMLLAIGLIAVLLRQPYAVWYPLVLAGAIAAGATAVVVPGLRRRYAEMELHRMAALDAVTT